MKTLYASTRHLSYAIAVLALLIFPCASSAQVGTGSSCLASGNWVKLTINQTGVYKLNATELGSSAGCPISGLALYGMEGGQLSVSNSKVPLTDLAELPIEVVDQNGNGLFDGNDYLIFYAEGASVWRYNSSLRFVEYQRNSYALNNYCFLTTSKASQGRRIVAQKAVPTAVEATYYTAVGVVDNDEKNVHRSGQVWVGERFSSTVTSRTVVVDMPQLVTSSTMSVKVAFAGEVKSSSQFTVALGSHDDGLTLHASNPYTSRLMEFVSGSGSPEFVLRYSPQSTSDVGYLDYIQVNAHAALRTSNSYMDMWCLEDAGLQKYPLQGSVQGIRVWDVTSPENPFAMKVEGNTFADSVSGVRHYVAFTPQQLLNVSDIQPLENQDIKGSGNPQLVVVTHPNFVAQAERLADLHRLVDGMEVLVVTTGQVYNEFSSGRPDPMSIRRMMRWFWKHADQSKPQSLLLFGRGTYDNRNLDGNNQSCVVTYQTPVSFGDEGASYCSDLILGYLDDTESDGSSGTMDISVGRMPAGTVQQANHLVDKVEDYVYRADLTSGRGRGDWRTYVTLLADDADPSCVWDTAFTSSSEYTANQILSRYPYINIDKIFADAYVQQSGAVGSFYPDVNNALRKRMNYGTLILNYVGHGSTMYIGTERYMEYADIDSYENEGRLAFFVGSTCSYGRFDNPEEVSGAEMLMLAENAGIGAIAASRPISHHKGFNTAVNLNLLNPDFSVGEALRQAQNTYRQSLSITLFGDPAMHLSLPQKEVVVTRINGVDVMDGKVDTATVLSEVIVEGEVRNSDGSLATGFNGNIFPIVYDRVQQTQTLANDNDSANVRFSQQKAVLFKGRDTVIDGRWQYRFIVPRDVAYDFDFGRLSHFASSGNTDASGSYSSIVFGGFNEDADLRETRPEISLFIGDSNFIDGGLVGQEPSLFAVLRDEIGINAFGSGLGHDITAVLDENPNGIINLNDFYETDYLDNHKGYVRYNLGKLPSGAHTLTLKAWNIFNYSSSATIRFRVQGGDTVEIGRFYAFPNPSSEGTTLHAEFNQCGVISSAVVEIYDSFGQLVRRMEPVVTPGSYVVGPVKWRFDSQSGARVARGVYLAQVVVVTEDGKRLSKATKVVVL